MSRLLLIRTESRCAFAEKLFQNLLSWARAASLCLDLQIDGKLAAGRHEF
ncbi:MAG: hypothetical protein ACC645_23905 [Pirellulales bacterium]